MDRPVHCSLVLLLDGPVVVLFLGGKLEEDRFAPSIIEFLGILSKEVVRLQLHLHGQLKRLLFVQVAQSSANLISCWKDLFQRLVVEMKKDRSPQDAVILLDQFYPLELQIVKMPFFFLGNP